jgi:hypothetical protein
LEWSQKPDAIMLRIRQYQVKIRWCEGTIPAVGMKSRRAGLTGRFMGIDQLQMVDIATTTTTICKSGWNARVAPDGA